MSTRTKIGNLALLRIGVSQQMTDVDVDVTREALNVRLIFDDEKLYCLRDFPWPFARGYKSPVLVEGSVETPANSDWIFGYEWPLDCVYVRRIVNCFGRQATSPPPYVIGRASAGGRLIFTNQESAQIEYTVDVTDAAEYEPQFVSMFAWRLASQLAMSLSRLPEVAKHCLEMYGMERAQAMARAVAEGEYAIASGEADPKVRELFNLALTRIGIARNVAAVDPEMTFAALWPRVAFADERDYVLRDFPWAFATKYALLTLVTGTAAAPTNDDWIFAYAAPDDSLFVRRLVTTAGRKDPLPPPFRMGSGIVNPEADEEDQVRGRLVYTNQPEATAEYTAQITDPEEFDPMFRSLLAWRLAALLAPSIANTKADPSIVARCNQGYEVEKSRAQRAALNEGQSEEQPDAGWISGRG